MSSGYKGGDTYTQGKREKEGGGDINIIMCNMAELPEPFKSRKRDFYGSMHER